MKLIPWLQDDAENAEHVWGSSRNNGHMHGLAGVDSPWIKKELRALRALCEESKRERTITKVCYHHTQHPVRLLLKSVLMQGASCRATTRQPSSIRGSPVFCMA